MRPIAVLFLAVLATDGTAADFEFDVMEKIVYSRVDDRALLLDAYVPRGNGPFPGVLVVHGGAWRTGDRGQLKTYATSLARMGFACFCIDYRLAPRDKFPAQIEDCRSAVVWIRSNARKYKVDPGRVGAIGYSAGGHLVTLLATTGRKTVDGDTRLQAVVAGGAPTDFRWFPDGGKWAEFLMGGTLKEVPEKFHAASAAAFVDADDPPVFFFNGTRDRLVPLVWTRSCYNALKAAGVRTEFFEVEGAGHLAAAVNKEALTAAFEFLREELKPPTRPVAATSRASTEDEPDPGKAAVTTSSTGKSAD